MLLIVLDIGLIETEDVVQRRFVVGLSPSCAAVGSVAKASLVAYCHADVAEGREVGVDAVDAMLTSTLEIVFRQRHVAK